MAKTNTMHIRISPETQKEVTQMLNDLGLSVSDAINVYFKQIIYCKGLPFEIRKPEIDYSLFKPSSDTEYSKRYDNLDDLWSDIEK